ncbi:MAG: hypothetical protein HDS77_04745 [Bacteroidales bacterium]|nr:hypothetical protein [Bacteroidales bacterium]MBD5257651.1 hypothetical protein [Barnesiella sp.]
MKKVKATFLALSLAFIGAGTIYALTIENNNPTEQVKIKRKCRTCDGTGKVKERITHSPCQGSGCEACDWNGYVIYTVTCSTCDGEGWIYVR